MEISGDRWPVRQESCGSSRGRSDRGRVGSIEWHQQWESVAQVLRAKCRHLEKQADLSEDE